MIILTEEKTGLTMTTTYTALAKVSELDRYLAQIQQYPVLSREEEMALARRWRDEGDVTAAHTLVTANLRFVVKIANEYRGYGARILDLIQEGSVGLMQAVKRFDPDRGYRLISYAVFWIRSYIHSFLMATTRMVKIGTSRAHRKLFFKLRAFKAMLGAKGMTDPDEVRATAAAEFGIHPDEVEEMNNHLSASDASLDAPVHESGTALLEVLPSPDRSQEELLGELEAESDMGARLTEAMNALSERERDVLESRYLSDEPVQLKELGERLGISKQRVAQIEKRALEKLRVQLTGIAA